MLKIGDKIKCVKASPHIEFPIGTEFTVTDIQGTTVALTGEYKCESMVAMVQGIMSYDEYEKYFEKCEPTTPWTEWKEFKLLDCCQRNCRDCEDCSCGILCDYLHIGGDGLEYKHNNKKVLVKAHLLPSDYLYPNAPKGKILRAYANCSPEDEFNLETGIKIALIKIGNQIAKQTLKVNSDILKNI